MICPRCGAGLKDTASECHGCGMPTVFMDPPLHAAADRSRVGGRVRPSHTVLEPEVLESLDAAEREGPQGHVRPTGCVLGPGCGCIGLPLLAIAGVAVSSVVALCWVLSLGRLPVSLVGLAARARRGFTRGRGPAAS